MSLGLLLFSGMGKKIQTKMAANILTPILKDLNEVMRDAVSRYQSEFIMQDVKLSEDFKREYSRYLATKNGHADYHEHTTVITTRNSQFLFIDNEWFAIASYFVDFCTELLTYREYYIKICDYLIKDPLSYAEKLRHSPSETDKSQYLSTAKKLLREDFPKRNDIDLAASFLWRFATDYRWWSGSKTVDRHDFYVSAVLSKLNVVNNSSGYLADIVHNYADDYTLRRLVDSVEYFTVGIRTRTYKPAAREQKPVEVIVEHKEIPEEPLQRTISISAASLERFKSQE